MIKKTLIILCITIQTSLAYSQNPLQWLGNIFSSKPRLEVECNKRQLQLGDSALIQWKAEKADSVVLMQTKETLPIEGQMVVKPTEKSFYKFVAYNSQKSSKSYIIIKVLSPTIKSFSGDASVTDEEGGELSWVCENTDKVFIKELGKEFPANGSVDILPDTTKTYTLIAENNFGGKAEKQFAVNVTYIENITKVTSILLLDTAELSWKFKNTRHVLIDGMDSLFLSKGKLYVAPKETTTYSFKVIRTNGDTLKKEVIAKVLKPHIVYFKGDKYVFKGIDAGLQWKASHVDSVYIEELDRYFKPQGFVVVSPTKETTYHIKIHSKGITQRRQHTINVVERAYVKDFIQFEKLKPNQRIDFQIFATDVSNYPKSIELYVVAVDTSGNFVRGLAPPYNSKENARKYFKSLVEKHKYGKPYVVKDFNVHEVRENVKKPFDINLTLDYSGSMLMSILKLEKACKYFVENKNEDDRISAVRFDCELVCETPLSADKQTILDSLNFPAFGEFGRSTALYAAADEGLRTLRNSRRNKQQILFTDGFENASFAFWKTHAFNGQMVAKRAKKIDTRINIAAFGQWLNIPLLKNLAMLTGGNYYQIYEDKEIKKVFTEIPLLFRNYYVISYKPQVRDGERTVQLVYNDNMNNDFISKKKIFSGILIFMQNF